MDDANVIREEFVDFSIAAKIQVYCLDATYLCGQVYDGADDMENIPEC